MSHIIECFTNASIYIYKDVSYLTKRADSPATSEVGGSNPEAYVGGKMVVSYRWLTVQNLDQLYVLVSSAYKTTRFDMTYTVLKATLNPKQINHKRAVFRSYMTTLSKYTLVLLRKNLETSSTIA